MCFVRSVLEPRMELVDTGRVSTNTNFEESRQIESTVINMTGPLYIGYRNDQNPNVNRDPDNINTGQNVINYAISQYRQNPIHTTPLE